MSNISRTMNKFILAILFGTLLPIPVFAQTSLATIIVYLISVASYLVKMLVALAVLVFFWGILRFMTHVGTALSDEQEREKGKALMVWGMVGLFVMVALWGIIGYIQSSLGLGAAAPLQALPLQPTTIPG